MSWGRFLDAWLTLSRTSFAAASRLLPSVNSTEILLLPTELEEVIVRIPGMPLIDFSSGSVI